MAEQHQDQVYSVRSGGERDIAEYGTRIIAFRDGRITLDHPVMRRRLAADELAAAARNPTESGTEEASVPLSLG